MSGSERVLVTGATGFLGSHLAWRLLDQGRHVTVLARGSRNASARQRALDALTSAAGSSNNLKDRLSRLDILDSEITEPDLGLSSETLRALASTIDEVWHCAASLSFTSENRDEIFRMNVGGTGNILEFVSRTSRKRMHHISTAYVAGLQEIALESEVNVGQTFRNAYEESKCQAELRIGEAHTRGDVVATIYRPSVVIGDSETGRVTHFHGVYAFIRGLWSTAERFRRKTPQAGVIHLHVRVPGAETTTLNFVPIDYVVNGMIQIGGRDSSFGGTYNLTNPEPTPNNFWLPHICRLIGVDGIQLVSDESFQRQPMNRMEALFQRQMAFYYMYLKGEPRFDCRRTLEALSGTGIECPRVTVPFMDHMIGWYINFLRNGAAA